MQLKLESVVPNWLLMTKLNLLEKINWLDIVVILLVEFLLWLIVAVAVNINNNDNSFLLCLIAQNNDMVHPWYDKFAQ